LTTIAVTNFYHHNLPDFVRRIEEEENL
jgi:hypothetical protein